MQGYIFEESGGNRENNIISFSINNPFYLYASPYYYAYYSTYLNTCIKYYDGNYNVRFGEIHATNNLSLQSRIFNGDVSYSASSMISGLTGNIPVSFSFAVLGVCVFLMLVTMFDSFRKRDIV
jgi:hypothetical protein